MRVVPVGRSAHVSGRWRTGTTTGRTDGDVEGDADADEVDEADGDGSATTGGGGATPALGLPSTLPSESRMNAGFSLRTMPRASAFTANVLGAADSGDLLLERLLAVGEQRRARPQVVQPERVLRQGGVQDQQSHEPPDEKCADEDDERRARRAGVQRRDERGAGGRAPAGPGVRPATVPAPRDCRSRPGLLMRSTQVYRAVASAHARPGVARRRAARTEAARGLAAISASSARLGAAGEQPQRRARARAAATGRSGGAVLVAPAASVRLTRRSSSDW